MKNDKNYLRKIKELKLHMVEFNRFGIIKLKIYSLNCILKKDN